MRKSCHPGVSFAVAALLSGSVIASAAQDPEEPSDRPEFYAPDEPLRAYVERALETNPTIRENLARYRGALERVPQVDTLPDLKFSFTQAIRSVETRVGPQRNAFTLSQAFPWFGKLDLRGQVALQEALAARELHGARQQEVILQVKRSYYELAYLDQALTITREERMLLEYYAELAETRYATGQGLQVAVIKLQAEITRVMNRLDLLEQQRSSVMARLNTLMDRPPQDPIPIVGRPSLPEVTLDLAELYQIGLEHRQELKATQERIEKNERAIDLAKRNSWPDFFVGVSFVNVGTRSDPDGVSMPPPDNGKNAFSISAGISLPIWREKYDADVREASEMLLAERSNYANVVNEMEFSIRDHAVRLDTLREQVRLFDSALIPQSEDVLRATEAAYETGQVGVLDLLDSERVLLNVRLVHARYYANILVALAELERALGAKFPG